MIGRTPAKTVCGSLPLHQVAGQPRDLAAAHLEDVAERQLNDNPILALSTNCAFGDNDVVLLDQPGYGDQRSREKRVVHNVGVELRLAAKVERARDLPFDVVGQAGQNPRPIGRRKPSM